MVPEAATIGCTKGTMACCIDRQSAPPFASGNRRRSRSIGRRPDVAERIIHALRMQAKRGKIAVAGRERGANIAGARGMHGSEHRMFRIAPSRDERPHISSRHWFIFNVRNHKLRAAWGAMMCKSLIDSIEVALIQLRYAAADYYSCNEGECAGFFSTLDAPLSELCKGASSTQHAIDLLRATPQAPLVVKAPAAA
jgi:hypothetical protein